MDAIGTTGNFSSRSHRSMQHYCIGSPDAQLAKVICQFLDRVHRKLPRGPILKVFSSIIRRNSEVNVALDPLTQKLRTAQLQRVAGKLARLSHSHDSPNRFLASCRSSSVVGPDQTPWLGS